MFAGKSLGTKYRADGYTPKKPVMIIPGLCSSCLKVTESPYEPWIGKRIWLSMSSIGFEKMWSPFGPRGKKKHQSQAPAANGTESEEALKRRWLAHMCLAPDGISDPEGIKLRAVKGLKGCKYLDPGALTDALSYVMGPLAEMLEDLGYVDGVNLDASPYDWRLPPFRLEERDGYFSELQQKIEKMYRENDNTKVVIIAHSLGNRVTHYFVRFMEKKVGREWASKYIDNWLAIGPLWLGAPKLLRAIITGDRMGLEAFLFPHEGITLARSLGSTPWMFPYICPLDHEFTTYSQLRDSKTGKCIPKTNKEILIEGGAEMVYNRYRDYFEGDPLVGTQDQVLKAPPIDRIYAIYGINLKTETFYFFKENSSKKKITDFALDSKGTMNNFKCEAGVAYETKNTRQNLLKGKKRGGDGTVPYPSLSYCRKWKGEINVKVAEIEGAEHREILKNRTFLQLVLEYVSQAPPPTFLPVTFSDHEYSVKYESKGKFASATLTLDKQYIRTKYSGKEFRQYYGNVSNIILDEQTNNCFFIDYDSTNRTASYQSDQSAAIVQEIAARCRYISEAKASYTEDRNEYGQTALHTAAINNELSTAIDLLKGQIDINAVDLSGNTPLIAAAEKGNLDMMIVLLQQNNIDVNKQANNNKSAIHHMCNMRTTDSDLHKWKSVMNSLKTKGIDLNVVADFGETPLHQATKSGKYDIIEWLIKNKCHVNAANNIGETPLHYAVRIGRKDVVTLLLQNGADRHQEAPTIGSPLALAKKTDPDLMAFIRDFSGESGVKGSAQTRTTSNVVGGVRDEQGRTPLHIAASEDRLDQVFALQLKNASVNDCDKNGYTPLHCAASNGHLDVLIVLLNSYGVDVNCQTNSGSTVLHYLMRVKQFETKTIEDNYIRALDLLKQKGTSLNITASRGTTPLHEACLLANYKGAKWLLENGAKVHLVSSIGFTPLHFAVQSTSIEVVKLLVEYGANPKFKTQAGTPLDIAKNINQGIFQYLSSVPAPKAGAAPPTHRRNIASSHRFQKQPSNLDLSTADEDDEDEVIYTLDDQGEEEYVPGSTSAVIPLAQRRQSSIRSHSALSVIFKKPPVGSRNDFGTIPRNLPSSGTGPTRAPGQRKLSQAPRASPPPPANIGGRGTRGRTLTGSGSPIAPPKMSIGMSPETPIRGAPRGRVKAPPRGVPARGRGTASPSRGGPPLGRGTNKSPLKKTPVNSPPVSRKPNPSAPVGCKFCVQCGVSRVPGSKFCGECGLRF